MSAHTGQSGLSLCQCAVIMDFLHTTVTKLLNIPSIPHRPACTGTGLCRVTRNVHVWHPYIALNYWAETWSPTSLPGKNLLLFTKAQGLFFLRFIRNDTTKKDIFLYDLKKHSNYYIYQLRTAPTGKSTLQENQYSSLFLCISFLCLEIYIRTWTTSEYIDLGVIAKEPSHIKTWLVK